MQRSELHQITDRDIEQALSMVARAEACCRGLAIGTLANGAQVLGVARRNDCLLAIAALHVEAHEIDPLLPWRNGGTN